MARPIYTETYRPQFHFTTKKGWINDPNGLAYYKGEYHLFYQHNPFGNEWGNMTWGHAVSKDLVHWQQLANAIEPDELGTIFSGSAVVDWNNTAGFQYGREKPLVAIYTSAGGTSEASKGQPCTQSIAYSNDRGRTWTKNEGNPVLRHIRASNRDPKVVWHSPTRRWIMALFLDENDFALFASRNLKEWTHLQDVTMPGCSECPDFFEMTVDGNPRKKRWVFTAANGRYLLGRFNGRKFTVESGPHQVDFGKNYYAVQTYSDIPESDGRRIQIAWMNGGQYPKMPFNQQMSFPCELTLRTTPEGIRLYRNPVCEIRNLRDQTHEWRDEIIRMGDELLEDLSGDMFEIQAEFELRSASALALLIRGEIVDYNVATEALSCCGATAPLAPQEGRIELRVLIDRTSIEVFGNDGQISMTSCFLPSNNKKSLGLMAVGSPVKVVSLKVHQLNSAWE